MKTLQVHPVWDDEASVGVATSEKVRGLATEADSLAALIEKRQLPIPELLHVNGMPDADPDIEIRFHPGSAARQ